MTREELLLELKDIAEPAEPAWWLLGPAYPLLLIAALALIGIIWYLRQRQRRQRWLLLATAEFERIAAAFETSGDTQQLSLQLSRWLKQVALLAYPHHSAQSLSGAGWLQFLDQALGDSRFSEGQGRVFGDAIYRRNATVDGAGLLDLCQTWLQAVSPRLLRRGVD